MAASVVRLSGRSVRTVVILLFSAGELQSNHVSRSDACAAGSVREERKAQKAARAGLQPSCEMECKAEGRHGRDQDKMPDAMEPEVDEPETDAGAAPDGPAAAAPNNTIYIRNINEKLKKEDLKQQLYALFNQFGPILEVMAKKTLKLKGQAFVVFRDISSASNALVKMNGFVFNEKPMVSHVPANAAACEVCSGGRPAHCARTAPSCNISRTHGPDSPAFPPPLDQDIEYARVTSDAVLKEEGSFKEEIRVQRYKRRTEGEWRPTRTAAEWLCLPTLLAS